MTNLSSWNWGLVKGQIPKQFFFFFFFFLPKIVEEGKGAGPKPYREE